MDNVDPVPSFDRIYKEIIKSYRDKMGGGEGPRLLEKLFTQAIIKLSGKQFAGVEQELEIFLDVICEVVDSSSFKDMDDDDKVKWLIKLVSTMHLQYMHNKLDNFNMEKELSEERLRRGIVAAQENERRRVTFMLHDDVIQSLAGVLLQVQMLSQIVKDDLDNRSLELRKMLVELEENVRNTIKSCRLATKDGDTFLLEKAGFAPAVNSFILDFENKNGMKVTLELKDTNLIAPHMNIHLFYIIREALTNVKKHAEASLVSVSIVKLENELVLSIKDNGKGFVWDENHRFFSGVSLSDHFGLFCIEQRAKILNGKLIINAAPGRGTELIVKVPINVLELDRSIVENRRGSPWIQSRF